VSIKCEETEAASSRRLTLMRDSVTDLGMTKKPCLAPQALRTWAGSLPRRLAISLTSGESMMRGLPVMLLPRGEYAVILMPFSLPG
jgi:hypothetical protein